MPKKLSIEALSPGMYVTNIIQQDGPTKIKKVGFIKSLQMVDGLKEMGVQVVEIDLDKSIKVEFESPQAESAILNSSEVKSSETQRPEETSAEKMTLTEKLLESDKEVEQVDRELSQQFHNSLVMSAVDEMPSQWELYAKPIATISLLAIMGFVLGFIVMQTPAIWSTINSPGQVVDNSTVTDDVNSAAEIDISNDAEREQDKVNNSTSLRANAVDSTNDELTEQRNPLAATNTAETENSTNIASNENLQAEVISAIQSIPSDDKQTAVTDEQSSSQWFSNQNSGTEELPDALESVQGVELTAGTRVLGYQGETSNTSEDSSDIPPAEQSNPQNDVNPELLARINQAIESLDTDPVSTSSDPVTVRDTFLRVDQLSVLIQDQLPSLSFSAHMYASDPQDRWVRVNGRRLEEGDKITGDLEIEEITSDNVVLNFRGQRFSMKALSDWQ